MGRAYLAIGVVTLLWAGNFTAGKIATEQIDPFFIAAVRILASAGVFYALLPREQRRIERADLRLVLPLALTGIAVNHVSFAAGIRITTPSHSAIIHAMIPVVVSILAWFLIREKLGPLALAGMGLAVAGALVVVLGATREEIRRTVWGDVITGFGIVAFSFYTIFGRQALERMSPLRAITLGFVFASPVMVPCLIYGAAATEWSRVTWDGWASLAYMFVCANLVCYRFHIYALAHLKAGQVAAFTTLQPAIGIGIAVLARRDVVTASLLAGSALALGGVILVQLRR